MAVLAYNRQIKVNIARGYIMRSKVLLLRCCSYDYGEVKSSISRGIELLGGIEQFVSAGEKILLKPNLLIAEPPEKCVTTHPAVFRGVAEIFLEGGANISWGDSPAVGKTEKVALKAGLMKEAEELNIRMADFAVGEDIFYDKAIQNKKFHVAKGVLECDGIVSIPKLKTHGLQRFTGSIKNQFGCVPGMLKAEWHLRIPDAADFAKMLVDLNSYLRPRLYIMDGIVAMEGNGPRGGTPKPMNLIAMSSDPVALDATICRIMDIKPENVPTIIFGQQSGMGDYLEKDIEILEGSIEEFKDESFKIERTPVKVFKDRLISKTLNSLFLKIPVIDEERCTRCGLCSSVCPLNVSAVGWCDKKRESPPTYDYKLCIKCYCCQELCPEGAISLRKPLVRRIVDIFRRAS